MTTTNVPRAQRPRLMPDRRGSVYMSFVLSAAFADVAGILSTTSSGFVRL